MTILRAEVNELIWRGREVIAAALMAMAGAYLIGAGGYLLVPVGAALMALAAGWALVALRRMRFQQPVTAPGVVEVDEGQIGYFGPAFGGFIALADLAEIRLAEVAGARQWRLKTLDAQVLLIPVAATGADRLFDAFAVLPGIDMAVLADALSGPTSIAPLWQRPRTPVMQSRRIVPHHHEKS